MRLGLSLSFADEVRCQTRGLPLLFLQPRGRDIHIENGNPPPLYPPITTQGLLTTRRISWTDMRLRPFSFGVSLLLAATSVSAYGRGDVKTLEYVFGDRVEVSCLNRSMSGPSFLIPAPTSPMI